MCFFFFFQAEDGIRDWSVTGVQTCALPILPYDTWASLDHKRMDALLRFETLAADFDAMLRKIGIEPVRPLPPVNVTNARDRDFSSYYTLGAIPRAVWVFGPYMKEWAYQFPESWGRQRVPLWAQLVFRLARFMRGVYW